MRLDAFSSTRDPKLIFKVIEGLFIALLQRAGPKNSRKCENSATPAQSVGTPLVHRIEQADRGHDNISYTGLIKTLKFFIA